jgi:hypothetical protein
VNGKPAAIADRALPGSNNTINCAYRAKFTAELQRRQDFGMNKNHEETNGSSEINSGQGD